MEEPGKVMTIAGDRAEVEVTPGDACAHCGASGFCNWSGRKYRLVAARNPVGARVGDRVVVRTPEQGRYRSAVVVFGLPVAMMVIGIVVGSLVWGDVGAAICAGAGLAVALGVLKVLDKVAARSGRSLPEVIRIVDRNEPTGGSDEETDAGGAGRDAGDGRHDRLR